MVIAEKRQSRLKRLNPIIDLSSPPKPLEQLPVQQTDAEVDALVKKFVDAMKIGAVKEIERNYPEPAKHTCKRTATVATIYGDMSTVNRVTQRHWRGGVDKITGEPYQRCEACYQVRVKRFTEQILYEFEHGRTLHLLDTPELKKRISTYRQRRNRKGADVAYLAFPHATGNGAWIVNNQSEGEALPEDCHELYRLIYGIADTSTQKRIGVSDSFGGDYAGNKGDTRRTKARKEAEDAGEDNGVVQCYTKKSTSQVVSDLETKGVAMSKHAKGAVIFEFAPTVIRILEEQGGWCFIGGVQSVSSENVTHKVHVAGEAKSESETVSTNNVPYALHSENEPEASPEQDSASSNAEPTQSVRFIHTSPNVDVENKANAYGAHGGQSPDSQESDRILALDIAFGGTRYARAS